MSEWTKPNEKTARGKERPLTAGEAVPAYVVHHPAAVWLVGPMFAALTVGPLCKLNSVVTHSVKGAWFQPLSL
jgi:hypothetical protein